MCWVLAARSVGSGDSDGGGDARRRWRDGECIYKTNSERCIKYVFGFGGAFGRLWRQRWRDGTMGRWGDGDMAMAMAMDDDDDDDNLIMRMMNVLFSVVCGVCVECGFGRLAAWLGTAGDGGMGLNAVLEDAWMRGDGGRKARRVSCLSCVC